METTGRDRRAIQMFLLEGSLWGTEQNTGCDLYNKNTSQPCLVFWGLAKLAAAPPFMTFSDSWGQSIEHMM